MNKLFVLLLLATACSSDDTAPTEPITGNYLFEDGFEVADGDLQDLFPADNSRWSTFQQVGNSNQINVEQGRFSEGNNSLRVFARATTGKLSKMNIEKGGFIAAEGTTVRIEANFYLASAADIENLLLIDLECCSCWDPSVADNQCPGTRLMMKANDYLSIERGKILGSTLEQTKVVFPRNEWVEVVWELVLSSENDGMNRLYINGAEAINEQASNMPNAEAFKKLFAENNIDFNLQEPLFYERFQIGITANPTASDIELFVDDVKLQVTQQ